jgi:hypothetical protein
MSKISWDALHMTVNHVPNAFGMVRAQEKELTNKPRPGTEKFQAFYF